MSTDTPPAQDQAPVTTELPNGAAPAGDGGVAPAEPQTETPDPAQASQPSEGEGETPDHRKAKYRFSEMSKALREAERKAEYYRGLADASRMGQNAPPPAEQPVSQAVADPEPDAASYAGKDFDPQYLRDVARWEGRQEARKLNEETRKASETETARQVAERAFEEGRTRFVAAREEAEAIEDTHPQYAGMVSATLDNIARAEPPGTPGRLVDVITKTENKAWVTAALATKQGLLQSIMALDPASRALAIGRIDAQISANLSAAPAPKPAAQPAPAPANGAAPSSQTPALQPPTQLNGKGSAAAIIDPNKASMDDYVRWRESMQ